MVDVTRQKTQDNRTVESWLLFAEDRLTEYQARRQQILDSSPAPPDGMPGAPYRKSDSTGSKGQALAALAEDEGWLVFIKDFNNSLAETAPHLFVVLRLRQEYRHRRGPNGWTGPCMARFPRELATMTGESEAKHFKGSRSTFHCYWREVVDLAAREAIRRGLL